MRQMEKVKSADENSRKDPKRVKGDLQIISLSDITRNKHYERHYIKNGVKASSRYQNQP